MLQCFFFIILSDFVIPQRVILAIMGFLAILNAYTMRISLSIAITELVVKKNRTEGGGGIAYCEADNLDTDTSVRFIFELQLKVVIENKFSLKFSWKSLHLIPLCKL